jgi:Ca2+-binding EF-hand superfamily protein
MSSKYVTGDFNSLDLSRLLDKIKQEFAIKAEKYDQPEEPLKPKKSDTKSKPNQVRIENYQSEQDGYFIKHILAPYLSSVYFGLIARSNKDYLSCRKTKQYLNMPELIGDRIVRQMNANGDERIDHDEFVKFFLQLLMGSLQQKMLIAFRVYDVDGDECISDQEVKIVLRNIPLTYEERYGNSFAKSNQSLSRVEYLVQKDEDNVQINKLLEVLFKETYGDGMYFEEF